MKINRRDFLKNGTAALGGSLVVGALAVNPSKVFAASNKGRGTEDGMAMLSDATRCIGCRSCERACGKANGLPRPETGFKDPTVFEKTRRTDPQAYTVVNRYENLRWKQPVFRKQQCMHCAEPACASACLVAAFKKTPEGAVIYNEDICLGCRYCMTACPFSMPTFEYHDAFEPAIRKCTMCYQRIHKGITPACASECPVEAIAFGKRSELIKIARERINNNPEEYIDHIYGEHEVGGTSWLYVSGVPFEELGLPVNVGNTPYPELTREFLSAVPFVLTVWPAVFGGIYAWMKRRGQTATSEAVQQTKEDIH
jgi:formate dehydrogenase iron-sulfur subunit